MTKTDFSLVLGLIGIVLSIAIYIISKLKEQNKFFEENDTRIIILLTIISILSSSFFINRYEFVPEKEVLSEEQILEKAEKYFNMGDYFNTIKYYKAPELDTCAVALSNLGYMYENGLGISKDLYAAKEYYRKAASIDPIIFINNYLAFLIKYPSSYDELLKYLNYANKLDSEVAKDFVIASISRWDGKEDDEIVDLFFRLDKEEQIDILDGSTYINRINEKDYVGFMDNEFSVLDLEKISYDTNTEVVGEFVERQANGSNKVKLITANKSYIIYYVNQKKFNYADVVHTNFTYVNKNAFRSSGF